MAIQPERLLSRHFPAIEQTYTERDTILYALSLGLGRAPTDPFDLRFCIEKDLRTLPSFALVLASPGFWLKEPDTTVDWGRVLHVQQRLNVMRELPPRGKVVSQTRIDALIDKGTTKGALLLTTRTLYDVSSGDVLATMPATSLLRGDGGFGGRNSTTPPPTAMPQGAPDGAIAFDIAPQAALLYRLNGDYNPLHADPAVATAAGFKQPILHGLASFGMAQAALLRRLDLREGNSLTSFDVRFTAPVIPGETMTVDYWRDAGSVLFRARVGERIVLDGGRAVFKEQSA